MWWVRINVTDNGSAAGPYDNPNATATFLLNVTTINHAPNITTNLSSLWLNGTQWQPFNFTVQANDTDAGDTLSFSITSNCTLTTDPWTTNITTINSTYNNGTALVSVMNLSNDHVACPYVTITVEDAEESDNVTTYINLTNINDAPTIEEMSYAATNTRVAGNDNDNASNLTAVKGSTFSYTINVTDPDTLTYAGDTFVFQDNSSLFDINRTTGVLTFLPNNTYVGNHSVLIRVNDSANATATRALFLMINNNTAPILQAIGNFSCAEDAPCQRYLRAVDPDPAEDLLFTSNNTDVFAITDVNATTYELDFTPVNDQVGTYPINITVRDQYGFEDQETFWFTVNNTNDAPAFERTVITDPTGVTVDESGNVTFGTVVEGKTKNVRIEIDDEDVEIGLDNLTYNWSFIIDNHALATNFSIVENGTDFFVVEFTKGIIRDLIGHRTRVRVVVLIIHISLPQALY